MARVPGAKEIATRLEKWYREWGRRFPWRWQWVADPYRALVIELLLQRTRAETVSKVCAEFFEKFPDAASLARSSEEALEETFRRLGLVYRARRLVEISKIVVEKYGGVVPCSMEDLLRLPGVGVYIASAVLSFACGEPTPVVDVNVMRVANRLWGATRESDARRFIEELYRFGDHRVISYALIDLGSVICKSNPLCGECPLNDLCPKLPLSKESWRMIRKQVGKNGKVRLSEQSVSLLKRKKGKKHRHH